MRAKLHLLLPLLLVVTSCGSSGDGTLAISNPVVEGPIEGGAAWVQATSFDLAQVGYIEAEYFISGTASAYVNEGDLGTDGVWKASPAGSAPYKTRIVVYRPTDPQRFNGTAVLEWLNVTGGLDAAPEWVAIHTELIREGYVWVGVSAQFLGVEGGAPLPGLGDLSLKAFNPQRYGSLSHPGDSFSYDIYSQAGQAVRRPDGIDPLGGLRPERLIAAGVSQSASRLVTYANAVQPLVRLYDGFLIQSRGGGSEKLSQSPQPSIAPSGVVHVRGDLHEPVLTLESETDMISLGYLGSRQPDASMFRLWEVAGTSHADAYSLVAGLTDRGDSPDAVQLLVTSSPVPGIVECEVPINSGPLHFVANAAIDALDRWIRSGDAPPMAARLEIAGTPAEFVVDDLGNVLGGIRTPAVDAPIARLSGLGQSGGGFCFLFGTTVPFDGETLAALYPDHETYVAAVDEATDSAAAAGFVRPADALLINDAAAESAIGE